MSETISRIYNLWRRGLNLPCARRERYFPFFTRHIVCWCEPKSVEWTHSQMLSCSSFHFHMRATFAGWCVACVLSPCVRAHLYSQLCQNDNRLFCFFFSVAIFRVRCSRMPWLGFKNIFYFALHNTKRECEWECVIKPAVILPFTRLFTLFCLSSSAHLNSISLFGRRRRRRCRWRHDNDGAVYFLHVQSYSLHVVYFIRISFSFSILFHGARVFNALLFTCINSTAGVRWVLSLNVIFVFRIVFFAHIRFVAIRLVKFFPIQRATENKLRVCVPALHVARSTRIHRVASSECMNMEQRKTSYLHELDSTDERTSPAAQIDSDSAKIDETQCVVCARALVWCVSITFILHFFGSDDRDCRMSIDYVETICRCPILSPVAECVYVHKQTTPMTKNAPRT